MSEPAREIPETFERRQPSHGGDDAIARLLDRPLTNDEIRTNTEQWARPPATVRKRAASVVQFTIGGEQLALRASDVLRITRAVRPHRIPHRSNEIIRGFGSIDGELVLCASLARLLGIADAGGSVSALDQEASQARTIVMGPPNDSWAFTADAVHQVVDLWEDDMRSAPATVELSLVHYTEALCQLADQQAALLDTQRILAGFRAALG